MKKNIILAILLTLSCSIYAQDKVKPSQMSTATKNAFKSVLGIDALVDTVADHRTDINTKAPKNSPTFTGTVNGITKSMVGLGSVDNTSDLDKPVSNATQDSLNARPTTQQLLQNSESIFDNFYSKTQIDSVQEFRLFNWWKSHGLSKMLSIPMFSYSSWGRTLTMTDGTLYVVLHKMIKDTVITKLEVFTAVTGNYTGDNYNGMLVYTVNSTGITEVARTTNDTEIWKTAGSTLISKTLNNAVTVTKGQVIGVGAIYNSSAQTTAPQLPSMGDLSGNLGFYIGLNMKLVSSKTSVTDPASSYTWATLGTANQLFGIWTR